MQQKKYMNHALTYLVVHFILIREGYSKSCIDVIENENKFKTFTYPLIKSWCDSGSEKKNLKNFNF